MDETFGDCFNNSLNHLEKVPHSGGGGGLGKGSKPEQGNEQEGTHLLGGNYTSSMQVVMY